MGLCLALAVCKEFNINYGDFDKIMHDDNGKEITIQIFTLEGIWGVSFGKYNLSPDLSVSVIRKFLRIP